MEFSLDTQNPILIPTNNPDSFTFQVIGNSGELSCSNLTDRLIIIIDSNGSFRVSGLPPSPTFNRKTVIRCGEAEVMRWPVHFAKNHSSYQEYFCFSVTYEDLNGEKILRQIYRIHIETPEKQIGIPNLTVHDSVESFLKKNNLW